MTLMTIAREIGAVQPMAPPPLPGVEANAMAQAIDVARPASVTRVTPPAAEEM
jgi:hypothetical protein